MPRRTEPDALAKRIGARVRELRRERAMTLEALAWETEIGKGHLSDLERGLTVPNVATLRALSEALGCSLADLVTFPEASSRAELADVVRQLSDADARRVLAFARSLVGK